MDEFKNLPRTIDDAVRERRNLTLKQITTILDLNGLMGEMFNIIHDNLQKKVRRYQIKIPHHSRIFYVSLYKWTDLHEIEQMIDNMLCGC